jgi:LPS-assembly protein
LFGSVDFSLLENYLLEYDFSLDNNFNNIEYNNVGVTFKKNNFLTKFNFIEENGKIGQSNSLANVTEFKFNENNYVYFGTRRNRETSLTEYYDLIYEYKNDCLSANIKYKKTYYQDRDLTPDEQIFFSITLFPLTTLEQKVNPDLYR